MKNINKFLRNSVRSELMGENMFVYKPSMNPRGFDHEAMKLSCASLFAAPSPLLEGNLGLGHVTDLWDVLYLALYVNGEKVSLYPVRNLWTPAYMDTYYRTSATGEYTRSGIISLREKKCINSKDIFVSDITLTNDDIEDTKIEVSILSSISAIENGKISVSCKTVPRGMKTIYDLKGFLYVESELGTSFGKTLKRGESFSFRVGACYVPSSKKFDLSRFVKTVYSEDPFLDNEKVYNGWFLKNVPDFQCDNDDLLKAYYYRAYLIKKCTFSPKKVIPDHEFIGSTFYESSIGSWYGCPIGLPLPMQIEEGKWIGGGKASESSVANFVRGLCRGYIQFTPYAVWSCYLSTGNVSMLKSSYDVLLKYASEKIGDIDSPSLPITRGSWPTGAEYQPAFYQFTQIPWDNRYDSKRSSEVGGKVSRLYRLDEISYTILNVKAVANIAKVLGNNDDFKRLSHCAEILENKLVNDFFDEDRRIFLDVDYETGNKCNLSAGYDSFAPFMHGVVDVAFADGLLGLLSEDKLGGEFSVSTIEKGNPMYWFDNAIVASVTNTKSLPEFYGCCWNGPVWPYANTIVLSGLGAVALKNKSFKEPWLKLFENYTELHFYLGDRSCPNIVEHYRPTDGVPFSVTHDYFHSSYIDLLFTYWAGIGVDEKGNVSFKPITKDEFTVKGITIRGKKYDFSQYKEKGKLCRKVCETV